MIPKSSEKKLIDLLNTFTHSNFMELLRKAYQLGKQDHQYDLEVQMDAVRIMREEGNSPESGAV